jgi:uncharacterized HAD superfamily protein/adenine/guanine phosphoribosyltransferase-like PRPP-binding protein
MLTVGGLMHYRSIADLNDLIAARIRHIPSGIDLVVGIPRSGLLAANMVALTFNLPLADLDGYCEGRTLGAGWTRRRETFGRSDIARRTVLIVDDSIMSGKSMREAKERIAALHNGDEHIYCAIFGEHDQHPDADLILDAIPKPRLFQWNLMHHDLLAACCLDIDGVLCADPLAEENDDSDAYRQFLLTTPPFLHPTRPVGHLVTSRLEKYRPETETWLKRAGIEYGKLWMLDLPNAKERRRQGAHGSFKASVYGKVSAALFIESETAQAQEIARLSEKPVLTIEDQFIIWPEQKLWSIKRLRAERERNQLAGTSTLRMLKSHARRLVRRG